MTEHIDSPEGMGRRFADAIMRGEERGDAEVIVALFHEDAELQSLVHEEPLHGIDGARRFWQEYLGSFRDLRSRFDRVREADGLAVLEWITDATLASGQPITYRGVSLVEHDGERVRSFRSYYDASALSGRHAGRRSASEAPSPPPTD